MLYFTMFCFQCNGSFFRKQYQVVLVSVIFWHQSTCGRNKCSISSCYSGQITHQFYRNGCRLLFQYQSQSVLLVNVNLSCSHCNKKVVHCYVRPYRCERSQLLFFFVLAVYPLPKNSFHKYCVFVHFTQKEKWYQNRKKK